MENINKSTFSFKEISLNAADQVIKKTEAPVPEFIALNAKINSFVLGVFKTIKEALKQAAQAASNFKADFKASLPKEAPGAKRLNSLSAIFSGIITSQFDKINQLKNSFQTASSYITAKVKEFQLELKIKDIETQVLDKIKQKDTPATVKSVYLSADEKEILGRMKELQTAINNDPGWVKSKIDAYQKDPLYKEMGDVKFLSMLAKSNANLGEKIKGSPLNELERVALFGYTTGDYKIINQTARQESKEIKEGMKAYIKYAKEGMAKLSDVEPPGDGVLLKRAIFTEPKQGWGEQTFQVGKTYSDAAFASTTFDLQAQGKVNLVMTSTKNAKDIGDYSAWPGEKEILIIPGVEYIVKEVKIDLTGTMNVILEPK